MESIEVGIPDWRNSERRGRASLRSVGKAQLREHAGLRIRDSVCDLHALAARGHRVSDYRLIFR
jgi:hypothetical protein